MRGLTQASLVPVNAGFRLMPSQFIADIRGARVRELEEKRINKEMANIRKKFKGLTSPSSVASPKAHKVFPDGNLDGYQKKK